MEIESDELPLYRAAETGDTDSVMSILSRAECDGDAEDEESEHTALHVACEKGFIAIVKLLLDAGASLQSCRSYEDSGDGYSALHMAAMGGSAATVELLLQRGADVHSLAFGRTPLHASCQFGRLEAASVLLQAGSDVNVASVNTLDEGCTPLHYAAKLGSEELVKLLLSCYANIGAVNKYGRTALHCAWQYENPDIAELLLDVGGSFILECGAAGGTPEVLCAVREDVVKILLNCVADINVRDCEGLTPLHWACRGKSPEVAECLLKSGADINAAVFGDNDFVGLTPLHFSIGAENCFLGSRIRTDLVELLLQWHGDVNAKNPLEWTPLNEYLHFYSIYDDEMIAKTFAKHIAMMQANELFVDEINLQAISDHETSREFIAACKVEIENMRRRFIGDSSVTLFNVLTKGAFRLADYMANESVQHAFESRAFECEFPIYAQSLRRQFVHGRQRLDLLRKTDSALHMSSFSSMPYVCMRNLKRCLSNDDLKSILKSKV